MLGDTLKLKDNGVPPLLLIDNAGCNLSELDVASNESKGNEGEDLLCFTADVVGKYQLRRY